MKTVTLGKSLTLSAQQAIRLLDILHVDACTWSLRDIQGRVSRIGHAEEARLLERLDKETDQPISKQDKELVSLLECVYDALDRRKPIEVMD